MSRTIALSRGGFCALVDDADFEELSKFNWHVQLGRTPRAIRWESVLRGGRKVRVAIYMHRQILGLPHGCRGAEGWMVVDHINFDTLDNRRANLRVATDSQSNAHRRSPGGTSSYLGVSRHVRGGWQAGISIDGRKKNLGRFASESRAAEAYNQAARAIHGEFAYISGKEPRCSTR